KGNTATDHLTALNGIQIGKSASAPIGSDSKRLYFGNSNENTDAVYIARYNEGNDISELRVSVGDDTSDRFVVGNRPWDSSAFNPVLTVKMNGNVGIGEADPAYTLDVKGKIRAEEVVITTAWADFVFADNYNLPSLKEVHQHIREKKHLPGIPSESEVKENGVGIADIQVKLLQKIEELTLYMIQQQQLIEQLQEKINTMNQ
ncbi:hypothetical protein LJB92_04110, partial [Bacteroidales bacterium OttesenSCG-928-M06]|nr:hypothetical protein [Bacteroidales bacterium OttesenSCG-928-M06]